MGRRFSRVVGRKSLARRRRFVRGIKDQVMQLQSFLLFSKRMPSYQLPTKPLPADNKRDSCNCTVLCTNKKIEFLSFYGLDLRNSYHRGKTYHCANTHMYFYEGSS